MDKKTDKKAEVFSITKEQLDDTIKKAVEDVKEDKARNKSFGTNFQFKAEKEENPQLVGAFIRASIEAKNKNIDIVTAANNMMESSRTYASEIVAKAVNETTPNEGGYLVIPEVSNQFLELLNAQTIFRNLPGVTKLSMKSNELQINRATVGATAYWGPEAPTPTVNAERFGQLILTPKQLTSQSVVSNLLIADSPFQAEKIVQEEIIRKMGVAEDNAFLTGTGASYEPTGLYSQLAAGNIITSSGTTTEQYEADFFDAEEAIRNANHFGKLTWIMNYSTYSTLRTKLRATTGIVAWPELRDATPTLLGHDIRFSNTTSNPSSKIFLLAAEDFIIADRQGIQILINPPSNDAAFVWNPMETLILASIRVDCGLKYDTSGAVIE